MIIVIVQSRKDPKTEKEKLRWFNLKPPVDLNDLGINLLGSNVFELRKGPIWNFIIPYVIVARFCKQVSIKT